MRRILSSHRDRQASPNTEDRLRAVVSRVAAWARGEIVSGLDPAATLRELQAIRVALKGQREVVE